MKVYVLVLDQVYDNEVMDNDYPQVYSSIGKAKEVFNRLVEDVKEYCERDEYEFNDLNDDTFFEAYEDGYYTQNHVLIHIFEREVA